MLDKSGLINLSLATPAFSADTLARTTRALDLNQFSRPRMTRISANQDQPELQPQSIAQEATRGQSEPETGIPISLFSARTWIVLL
jgi:hypothetical protein